MCKQERITFVLGAGATSAFLEGLNTDYLSDELFKENNWNNVLIKFNDLNEKVTVSPEKIIRKIKEIRTFQDSLDQNNPWTKSNFETIIHGLDIMLQRAVDEYCPPFTQSSTITSASIETEGWGFVPFLAREVIVDATLRKWNSTPETERQKAIIEYRNFFNRILKTFCTASIYSLNYDPLLYESLKDIVVSDNGDNKKFCTGFETDIGNTNWNFKEEGFYRYYNVMAFPHGHVGFVPYPRVGLKPDPLTALDFRFNMNYTKAQDSRFLRIRDLSARDAIEQLQSCSITTGLNKLGSFYNSPYTNYIARFLRDIHESSNIVLIGTSFKDYHLTMFLDYIFRNANLKFPDSLSYIDIQDQKV